MEKVPDSVSQSIEKDQIQAISNGGNVSLSEMCSLINYSLWQDQTQAKGGNHWTKHMEENEKSYASMYKS